MTNIINSPISVVIPTYNGLGLLKQNLPSVLRELRSGDELIVIEDAGSDKTTDWMIDKFDLKKNTKSELKKADVYQSKITYSKKIISVKFIYAKENLRFAAAVNLATRLVETDYMFLINNDVSLHKNCIEPLLKHFEDKTVFGVAAMEIETHDNNLKSGRNELYFHKGMFFHRRKDDLNFGDNAWVTGGSGMFDMNKWRLLGGFDMDFYPAYWEDIDISHRAKKRHWKVLFEPDAIVDHNHQTTNEKVFGSDAIQHQSWKSAVVFTRKHANLWQLILHFLWWPYWRLKYKRWQASQTHS